jgi:hypothetical protein
MEYRSAGMFGRLNQELPGHKWYRGTSDAILEWREPTVLRQRLAASELKKLIRLLPILFPLCALAGLALFAGKVASKGHSLSEIPLSGLIAISCILGFVLCLKPLLNIAILRWDPVVVRLASRGVGKWCNKPDTSVHSDYEEIKTAFICSHPIAPEVKTVVLTLKNGKEAGLALPASVEPGRVLEILTEHGVMVLSSRHGATCDNPILGKA